MRLCSNHLYFGGEIKAWSPDTHRLCKFSSEKGSASLEILLTLDLPRAMMSEDGEPSDVREDEMGPCAFESDAPSSSVGSVGMAGW